MKNLVFIIILLCSIEFVFAQEKPLTQTEYVKLLYSLQKTPAIKADIIEALRKRGIDFVLTDGLRGLTRSKGANDDELKRSLEEADRRRLDPVSAKLPSTKEADKVLEKVRENTLAALGDMPDFVVKELISRSAAYAGTGNWKPLDSLAIAVSYSNEKGEEYKVLAVNGALVNAEKVSNYGGLNGATTGGEFVEQLQKIFKSESKTEFKVIDTDVIRNRRAIIFQYEIKIENNMGGGVSYEDSSYSSTPAGQLGKIWVDRESFRVLRIEYQLTDIALNFPIKAFQSNTDYDWVTIAEEKYLLPLQSDSRFTIKSGEILEQTRNSIRFKNYQKYGTNVVILDDDVKPEPEAMPEVKKPD